MNYRFINSEYLDSIGGGDNDVILEIIDMFRDQVNEMYTDMIRLLADRNFSTLGMLAHKAKSSVSIMGMEDLASMLKTFELQAKEGIESEKYESYIARFKSDTGEAVKELDDLIKNRIK